VLSLARAVARDAAVPTGTGLSKHILAVTRAGGSPVAWNELSKGIELLRSGVEVQYFGLSGFIEFDVSGQTPAASTGWWTISENGFTDVSQESNCH
jgi:hypothetical protein